MEARLNICGSIRVRVHLHVCPAPLISSPQRGAPGPHPPGPVWLIECDGADIISILSPWLGIRNSCSLASANRIKSVLGRARESAKRRVSVSSTSNREQTGDRPVHYTHNRLAAHTHRCMESYFSLYIHAACFHLQALMRKCPHWWQCYHFAAICLL